MSTEKDMTNWERYSNVKPKYATVQITDGRLN